MKHYYTSHEQSVIFTQTREEKRAGMANDETAPTFHRYNNQMNGSHI